MQKTDEKRTKSRRRGRLAWGLVIATYFLLSMNLFDSVQIYLGHRMMTGHLLWALADARGWYGLANYAQSSTVIYYLLTLIFIFTALVVMDEPAWGTGRLGIGIVVCFLLLLAGMVVPALRGASNPSITTCIDVQRQLSLAMMMSAQDHGGRFPTDWSTFDSYLGWSNNGHYLCPLTLEPFHQPGGYGLNGQIAGLKEGEITDPKVFLIADSIQSEMILRSNSDIASRRHHVGNGRGFALSSMDGHVKFVPEDTELTWK